MVKSDADRTFDFVLVIAAILAFFIIFNLFATLRLVHQQYPTYGRLRCSAYVAPAPKHCTP